MATTPYEALVMKLWTHTQRLYHIVLILIKHGLVLGAERLGQLTLGTLTLDTFPGLARRLPVDPIPGSERLRMVFEEVGGTFIKLGQMLALQPDILPLDYCNALFKLLDRITPFEYDGVEKTFMDQFGRSPMEIFDHFDPEPIATASIGQVYIAYLDDRKLAVKVQRPSVEADYAGDIRLMTALIRAIRILRLRQMYWMLEPLSEFVSWTREELDFRFEARYMEQLHQNARENAREYIPYVVRDYTTQLVLTMEFLEGTTLLNYIRALETGDEVAKRRLHAEGFEPNQFARNVIENFLFDAFQHGMFHADLHPANLMVLHNNVVGYIDFGITGVLSSYLRRHLVALTLAYSRGDLDGMWEAFFKVSALDKNSDVATFRQGLEMLADEWYEYEGKERRLLKNITLVMLDLLKLSRKTGIWPERDVIKYIRSAIAIDGLITRFAPSFDVGQYLELVCDRYLKWHGRQELFAFDTLVDWSSANGNLMRDGALRTATILERLASNTAAPSPTGDAPVLDDQEALPQRAMYMGAIVFTTTLLIVLTQPPPRLGINLFTAEALLIVVTAVQLVRTIRRLV